jgi:hypothetical protein
MSTTRKDATILAILDAEVRDCDARIDQARLFANGPECANVAREKHTAVRLRRQIREAMGLNVGVVGAPES